MYEAGMLYELGKQRMEELMRDAERARMTRSRKSEHRGFSSKRILNLPSKVFGSILSHLYNNVYL